jgi:Zn-dependent alcohol dehydrogenase
MPTFPEEAKIAIDGTVTIKNLLAKFGVEKIIAMRDADKVNAAIQQMTQLQGGQPGAVTAAAQQQPQTGTPQPDLAGPAPVQPQYQLRSRSF